MHSNDNDTQPVRFVNFSCAKQMVIVTVFPECLFEALFWYTPLFIFAWSSINEHGGPSRPPLFATLISYIIMDSTATLERRFAITL